MTPTRTNGAGALLLAAASVLLLPGASAQLTHKQASKALAKEISGENFRQTVGQQAQVVLTATKGVLAEVSSASSFSPVQLLPRAGEPRPGRAGHGPRRGGAMPGSSAAPMIRRGACAAHAPDAWRQPRCPRPARS